MFLITLKGWTLDILLPFSHPCFFPFILFIKLNHACSLFTFLWIIHPAKIDTNLHRTRTNWDHPRLVSRVIILAIVLLLVCNGLQPMCSNKFSFNVDFYVHSNAFRALGNTASRRVHNNVFLFIKLTKAPINMSCNVTTNAIILSIEHVATLLLYSYRT